MDNDFINELEKYKTNGIKLELNNGDAIVFDKFDYKDKYYRVYVYTKSENTYYEVGRIEDMDKIRGLSNE